MSVTTPFTITYSEGSQGFPSFYSYIPDFIVGMNQYLYTFKRGNLYRHNSNDVSRNSFYADPVVSSTITTVFNEAPLQNKIFKTINLEGDDAWKATIVSDIQNTGLIEASYFEKKEASWFGFVRNNGPTGANTVESEWELRSLNGIGSSISIGGAGTDVDVNFALTVNIGSIISVGDNLYFGAPTPTWAGTVKEVNIDKPNGINQIVVNTSPAGATPPTSNVLYYLYIKNPIAESHGILGHYAEIKLELPDTITTASELFAVESEIMKSFP